MTWTHILPCRRPEVQAAIRIGTVALAKEHHHVQDYSACPFVTGQCLHKEIASSCASSYHSMDIDTCITSKSGAEVRIGTA